MLTLIFLVICALGTIQSSDISHASLPYPWNHKITVEDRQNKLLENMRSGDPITLLMNSDIVPLSIRSHYRNLSAELGSLRLFNDEGEELEFTSVSQEEVDQRREKIVQKLIAKDIDPLSFLQALPQRCMAIQFPPEEYWVIEWCHRQIIRQYHLQADNQGLNILRAPDWSLGSFKRSEVIRLGDNNDVAAPVQKVIDHYSDGQHCDETQTGRRTEVHFECCKPSDQPRKDTEIPQSPDDFLAGHLKPPNPLTPSIQTYRFEILSFSEVETCVYHIRICADLMCPVDPMAKAQSPSSPVIDPLAQSEKVFGLDTYMALVRDKCLYRQEEWWTYELCFDKGIRQYHSHLTAVQQPDGTLSHTTETSAEFRLGNPPIELYTNITALIEHTLFHSVNVTSRRSNSYPQNLGMPPPNILGSKDEVNALLLEFVGGTPCDIRETARATTAVLKCGPREIIRSIKEDRTCHYIFTVESPVICMIPSFEAQKKKYTLIELTVLDKDGQSQSNPDSSDHISILEDLPNYAPNAPPSSEDELVMLEHDSHLNTFATKLNHAVQGIIEVDDFEAVEDKEDLWNEKLNKLMRDEDSRHDSENVIEHEEDDSDVPESDELAFFDHFTDDDIGNEWNQEPSFGVEYIDEEIDINKNLGEQEITEDNNPEDDSDANSTDSSTDANNAREEL